MAAVFIRRGNAMLVVHNIKGEKRRVEPPGGKVEAGETHQKCAERETREELGTEVELTGRELTERVTETPEKDFHVRLFVAKILQGEPTIQEPTKHDRVEWCDITQLRAYRDQGYLVPNLVKGLDEIEKELAAGE
jgi:8-oxo-dGTP diphosphatase